MALEPQSRRRSRKRLEFSERRDSILDSALQLVSRADGFNISMAQIAEHEGVSKPVVYDHFANIDELLSALFRRERTAAVADMLRILEERIDSDDPGARLAFALERAQLFLGQINEHPERWSLTFQPPLSVTPETRQLTEDGKDRVHRAMIELLGWALPDPGAIDLDLTAHAVQAVIERMAHLLATQPDDHDVEEMLAFAVQHVGWWFTGRAAFPAPAPTS